MEDTRHHFLLTNAGVLGQWAHIDEAWRTLCRGRNYPEPIQQILGEALVASVLLAGTLKHDGHLILQIRGDGPVHLLVAQADAAGELRGLVRYSDTPESEHLSDIFGNTAQMVLTLEQPENAQRYQGIVDLNGESLSEALQHYFSQSEQLPTRLSITSDAYGAAGLLVQAMPEEGPDRDEDGWNRINHLLNTLTQKELSSLNPEMLLQRLFHQEGLALYEGQELDFSCSCGPEKIEQTLLHLGQKEAHSILEEAGVINITCEFCNQTYVMDAVDVMTLFTDQPASNSSKRQH